jgi:hypothetical protein
VSLSLNGLPFSPALPIENRPSTKLNNKLESQQSSIYTLLGSHPRSTVYSVKGFLYRVQEYLSSRLNEVNPPPPPPLGSLGGATLACGEGGGRTQVRQLDRHSDTQYSKPFMIYCIASTRDGLLLVRFAEGASLSIQEIKRRQKTHKKAGVQCALIYCIYTSVKKKRVIVPLCRAP